MSKKIGGDGSDEDPIYAVEMRDGDDAVEVAIVRIPRGGEAGAPADVWVNRFASPDAARIIVELMMQRPNRWPAWARMASILGMDFLTGVIEAEVIEAARGGAEDGANPRADAKRRVDQTRAARTVYLSLVLEGAPRIVAIRGGRPFMVLTPETAMEARRLWDWVRWQANAFQDWFVLARLAGATALEVMILNATRIEEDRAKAAGLAVGGPRPLRYWRPGGRAEPWD